MRFGIGSNCYESLLVLLGIVVESRCFLVVIALVRVLSLFSVLVS